MRDLQKAALLLTHGTIYGCLDPVVLSCDFAGISGTIANGFAATRLDEIFINAEPVASLQGPMTRNEPIDFISWSGSGYVGITGMEIWQRCLTLFMRHI